MKYYISITKLIMSVLFLCSVLLATNKVGTVSGQYLKMEVGPRAAGMGNAFVAVSNDATSPFWNPAGLANMDGSSLFASHNEWIAGVNHDFLSAAFATPGFGTVGASLTSVTMDEMMVRTEEKPDGTGEYWTATDISFALSYARHLTDRFIVGLNGKYIRQEIWHESASGAAIDIGTLYRTRFHDMTIGMSISNFGTDLKMEGRDLQVTYDESEEMTGNNDNIIAYLETQEWQLPLTFRVGVAMDVINNPFMRLTAALDAVHPNDVDEYLNVGTECAWNETIFLRAGIRHMGNDIFAGDKLMGDFGGSLTLGAGLQVALNTIYSFTLDWAYIDYGLLQDTQKYAISFNF